LPYRGQLARTGTANTGGGDVGQVAAQVVDQPTWQHAHARVAGGGMGGPDPPEQDHRKSSNGNVAPAAGASEPSHFGEASGGGGNTHGVHPPRGRFTQLLLRAHVSAKTRQKPWRTAERDVYGTGIAPSEQPSVGRRVVPLDVHRHQPPAPARQKRIRGRTAMPIWRTGQYLISDVACASRC